MAEMVSNEKKKKLALKSFVLADENNSEQLILAHKQISETEHFVFTHGEDAHDKLRCFCLTQMEGESYRVQEVLNPKHISEVAQAMGVAQDTNN